MDDSKIDNVSEVKQFLDGSEKIQFHSLPIDEQYRWMGDTLIRFEYATLRKKKKGIIRRYLQKFTQYSGAQLTRLISKYVKHGVIVREKNRGHRYQQKYFRQDICLLLETDNLHRRLSGGATKKILEREYGVYGRTEYGTISCISIAHIYNLRKTKQYEKGSQTFAKTCTVSRPYGERVKPRPNGCPGYLRVDSVHQGDKDKEKGVYHINLVDEVTQWEIVLTVEGISEAFLHPALEEAIYEFPFVIMGFHTDNGSEYVNETVAKLLNKLLVHFTKSRARRTNDNALVEGKNGSVIRKQYGYAHIQKKYARRMNEFNARFFNVYVNYHRPCFFPEIKVNAKGKETKRYPYKNIRTPYEKLKSLPKAKKYLREGVTFQKLDAIANAMSDNQFVTEMRQAEEKMWEAIDRPESSKRRRQVHKIQYGKGGDRTT